jgi:predicted GNAT family acetyltransferase
MPDNASPFTIRHNADAHRFETTVDGHMGTAGYQLEPGVLVLTHTVVHPSIEGHGIAAALVRTALDHARSHGLKVRPLCSYTRAYMERHPETQDLHT